MLIRETAEIVRKSDEQISPGIKRLLGLREANALTVLASYYPMITFTRKEGGVVRMKLPRYLSSERVMRVVPQHVAARIDGHGLLLSLHAASIPQSRPSPPSRQISTHEGSLLDLRIPQNLAKNDLKHRRSFYPSLVARACEALALGEREEHALFRAFRAGVKLQVQQFKLSGNPPRVELSNLDVLRGRGYETLLKDLGFQNVSASIWSAEWRKVPLNALSPGFHAKIDFGSTITVSITTPSA